MKTFFYSFCLFLIFCLQIFGSSFDGLDEPVKRLVLGQHKSHKRTVDSLRDGLLNAGKTSAGAGKGSSKSSKSVTQNWGDVNFAMGSLLIIKDDGSHKVVAVQGVGVRQADDKPTIYDSCSDRTCNILPDADVCVGQWKRYLGDGANILSDGTTLVKEKLIGDIGPLKAIESCVSRIQTNVDDKDPLSFYDFSQIKEQIKTYQSLLSNSWVPIGWHSEQRLIFDLDGYSIKKRLGEIPADSISKIIACVHTHLSPCCSYVGEEHPKCECMRSLSNWPKKWTFSDEIPGVSVSMTVSYSREHPSFPASLDSYETGRFFLKNLGEGGAPLENLELAKEYLKTGKLNRQIRRTFNPYEKRVINLLKPLWELAKNKWVGFNSFYRDNESNLHDVRDFHIKFPGGGKLIKLFDNEAGKRVLRFVSPGPVSASSAITELSSGDVSVSLNPEESDWNIWLSALFLCLSSSV
jgi:hypothetical protein